jgi:hypothetical protein
MYSRFVIWIHKCQMYGFRNSSNMIPTNVSTDAVIRLDDFEKGL